MAQTRRSIESLDLQRGNRVEFRRPPTSKNDSGWLGPANIIEIVGCRVTIRWHELSMQCRTPDIRRALVLYVMLAATQRDWSCDTASDVIVAFTEAQRATAVRLGWCNTDGLDLQDVAVQCLKACEGSTTTSCGSGTPARYAAKARGTFSHPAPRAVA